MSGIIYCYQVLHFHNNCTYIINFQFIFMSNNNSQEYKKIYIYPIQTVQNNVNFMH